MIKRVEVLGIQLDNYTVREALGQVEAFLENQVISTVEYISMQMLMDAQEDAVLREVLSALDLSIIGEKQILQAIGISDSQRIREIKENEFLFEFLKRLERNKKAVYLLGETTEQIEAVKEEIISRFPRFLFAGEYALENCGGDEEAVINNMNATTPDVILSVIRSPLQEHFLAAHKDKISASVWYGIGSFAIGGMKSGVRSFLQGKVQLSRFKNRITQYEEMR